MVHQGAENDGGHVVEFGDGACWCDYALIPSG